MKILYDHQTFNIQRFGGVSRYFYELIKHSGDLFEPIIGGIFSGNTYAKELGFKSFPIKFKYRKQLVKFLNERNSLKKSKGKCDAVHLTYYDNYLLGKTTKPIVITIHDMIHELFPNGFTIFPNKKPLLEYSAQIVAISQNTKKDILKFYPQIPEEKISIIYHGVSWDIKECGILNGESEEKQSYMLFTGKRGSYKNFKNFILAIAPLLIKYNLLLKCTGKSFTSEETDLLKQQNIFERTSVQLANEQELRELYAGALCFVFPSLYEGFGIPILEAFACGCPLVCSNASCFPEIAGNAAIYFDPNNIENMREKIDKVICSETLRKDIVGKGYERLKFFSWEKCAEETAAVYRKLLNEVISC